jgi:hypothetical protein
MTTEDLHGNERRSAPPALPPLVCMVIPDHASFSVLRETHMTFAWGHFKKLKCCLLSNKKRGKPESQAKYPHADLKRQSKSHLPLHPGKRSVSGGAGEIHGKVSGS